MFVKAALLNDATIGRFAKNISVHKTVPIVEGRATKAEIRIPFPELYPTKNGCLKHGAVEFRFETCLLHS
jgi:hypothetical protein